MVDSLHIEQTADSSREHRKFAVYIPTTFTIEMQMQPSWEDDGTDSSYASWGVWDSAKDDWASEDAKHFDDRHAAIAWLKGHINERTQA